MRFVLVVLFLSSAFLFSACEAEMTKIANLRSQRVLEDVSPPAQASIESPFVSVKKHYVLEQFRSVDLEFSLYVHDGRTIGYARLNNPESGDTLSCFGPGGPTFFSFSTQVVNLNPVRVELVTFSARLGHILDAVPGKYRCGVDLYDDLGNRLYVSNFEVFVVENKE